MARDLPKRMHFKHGRYYYVHKLRNRLYVFGAKKKLGGFVYESKNAKRA